jgi:hypothetical protein
MRRGSHGRALITTCRPLSSCTPTTSERCPERNSTDPSPSSKCWWHHSPSAVSSTTFGSIPPLATPLIRVGVRHIPGREGRRDLWAHAGLLFLSAVGSHPACDPNRWNVRPHCDTYPVTVWAERGSPSGQHDGCPAAQRPSRPLTIRREARFRCILCGHPADTPPRRSIRGGFGSLPKTASDLVLRTL